MQDFVQEFVQRKLLRASASGVHQRPFHNGCKHLAWLGDQFVQDFVQQFVQHSHKLWRAFAVRVHQTSSHNDCKDLAWLAGRRYQAFQGSIHVQNRNFNFADFHTLPPNGLARGSRMLSPPYPPLESRARPQDGSGGFRALPRERRERRERREPQASGPEAARGRAAPLRDANFDRAQVRSQERELSCTTSLDNVGLRSQEHCNLTLRTRDVSKQDLGHLPGFRNAFAKRKVRMKGTRQPRH